MKLRFRPNASIALDLPEGAEYRLNGAQRRLERPKLALCRCGGSANKPFCDGTHKAIGFEAEALEAEINFAKPLS